MEPAESIARLGFARWYERRLIEGHAWFVTAFISLITVAACIEELNFRGSPGRLLAYLLVVVAAGATGVYGLARYQRILGEAERLGEQATCGTCGAYARFKMISGWQVKCRKCGNEWRLTPAD